MKQQGVTTKHKEKMTNGHENKMATRETKSDQDMKREELGNEEKK